MEPGCKDPSDTNSCRGLGRGRKDTDPVFLARETELKKWKGLHVTLTGFAPLAGTGYSNAHGHSLITTIDDLVKNFQLSEHCTKKGQEGNHWSLNATSKLPLAGNGTQYMYAIPSSFSFVCLFLLTMRESALSLETVHICFKN